MAKEWDEKSVFLAARSLPLREREAFLRGACPDAAARERIDRLLQHHDLTTGDLLTPQVASQRSTQSPLQIDEFRILHRLGEGGMGVVYLAEDTVLGRRVALKVLASHLSGSERALARFREEARSAAALRHPAIVPVFKFGNDGRNNYIISEFVDGTTLAAMISTERQRRDSITRTQSITLWLRRSAEIAAVIADGLDCSHRAGIIHRDVKPSNILIGEDGAPRLTDFGIAKHLTEEDRTRSAEMVGSCHYMSPEQAAIAECEVDQRSDVFSLGVVLYEMIALRRPFDGGDVHQVLRAVIAQDPVKLRYLEGHLDRDLETICHKALEKEPPRRYQTAAHMAADLRCYLSGRPILAAPPGLRRQAWRWLTTHRFVPIGALCALLLVIGVALLGLLQEARGESLAWLSVDPGTTPCNVYMQRVDPATLELEHEPRLIGKAPIHDHQLPAGQYRITVVHDVSGAFAEFNAILLQLGQQHRTVFRVRQQQGSTSSEKAPNDGTGATSAVLMRSTDMDERGMVVIQAGEYDCGIQDDTDPVLRRCRVRLPAFYMDRTEVSNRAYREFADATGHPWPKYWQENTYDVSLADRPVVDITLQDAEAYARWRGARLPTKFEWEAAARGVDGRLYPWGAEFLAAAEERHRRNLDPSELQTRDPQRLYDAYKLKTVDVGFNDNLSDTMPFLQTFGNVRELTESIDIIKTDIVVMGRCWIDDPREWNLAAPRGSPLAASSFRLGFRCAKSAKPPGTNSP